MILIHFLQRSTYFRQLLTCVFVVRESLIELHQQCQRRLQVGPTCFKLSYFVLPFGERLQGYGKIEIELRIVGIFFGEVCKNLSGLPDDASDSNPFW